MNKVLGAALSASLILLSPGLPAHAAVAGLRAPARAAAGRPALSRAGARFAPLSAPRRVSLSPLRPSAAVAASAAPAALAVAARSAAPRADAALPLARAVSAARASEARSASPAPVRAVSVRLAAIREQAGSAIARSGDVSAAPAASAGLLGRELEDAMLDTRSSRLDADASPSPSVPMGEPGASLSLARAAGESIQQAAKASAGDGPPAPPSEPGGPSGGGSNGSGGAPSPRGQGPLLPRLLASAVALGPAYFLGLPLIAAEAYMLGGLLVASSASLALLPLLGARGGAPLRSVPGFTLATAGLSAVSVTISLSLGLGVPTSISLFWPGVFAALAGWGLTRYATSGPRDEFERLASVSGYFGAVSALTGLGVAAIGAPGWAGTVLVGLSYPLSAMLWFHLPGWVGRAALGGLSGVYQAMVGASRVAGASRNDTAIYDRLFRFSERKYRAWKWNAVWLGLLLWGPLLLLDAAYYILGFASGLLVGLAQAPAMIAWSAASALRPGSRAQVLAAEWARPAFDHVSNGKKAWFNRAELRLLPLANSASALSSAGGLLALRALQLGWLAAAPLASAALAAAGLFLALRRSGRAYDPARHAPGTAAVDTDDEPAEKPSDPDDGPQPAPGGAPFAAKLFTGLLALAPSAYFLYPMIFEGLSLLRVGVFLTAALPLALLPFMGKGTPPFFRAFAGRGLVWNGLALLMTGHAIWAGLLATLAGWGYLNYMAKLERGEIEDFDGLEVTAFFGTLGSAVAVGAAWSGMGGAVAAGGLAFGLLTSPALLMHLPAWVGAGALGFFAPLWRSYSAFRRVLSFWLETGFAENLADHAKYWLDKHWAHGVWLSLIWVPAGLAVLAEWALSVALGAAFGLVRAPVGFVARALDSAAPGSRAARFSAALLDGWLAAAEGSTSAFERLTRRPRAAMSGRAPVSGRPTLAAALAFLVARVAQLAWLLGVAVMLPLGLLYGLYRGYRAASAP